MRMTNGVGHWVRIVITHVVGLRTSEIRVICR